MRTSLSPLWWVRISPRRLIIGGVTLAAGMVRTTGALVPAFDRSGTWSSIATSRGTSSRLSRRPLTNTTASSTSWVDTQLVGGREEHALDGAGEVLHGGDGPGVALLGHLALEAGDDAADGHHRAVGVLAAGQLGDARVGLVGQHVLQAEERVVGDVQTEHLPLLGEQIGLVPLVVGELDVESEAGLVALLLAHAAEEVELPLGLLALDRDHVVDHRLVVRGEALAGVPQRVERARLDQRLGGALVAGDRLDLVEVVGEGARTSPWPCGSG